MCHLRTRTPDHQICALAKPSKTPRLHQEVDTVSGHQATDRKHDRALSFWSFFVRTKSIGINRGTQDHNRYFGHKRPHKSSRELTNGNNTVRGADDAGADGTISNTFKKIPHKPIIDKGAVLNKYEWLPEATGRKRGVQRSHVYVPVCHDDIDLAGALPEVTKHRGTHEWDRNIKRTFGTIEAPKPLHKDPSVLLARPITRKTARRDHHVPAAF